MIDLATNPPRLPHFCSGEGQNGNLHRLAPIGAALAALAILIAAAWHPPIAHADGGSPPARSQTSAPDDSDATIRAQSLQILRALIDRDSNNWARYWQARHACDASPAADHAAAQIAAAAPRSRALLALTASICARLHALLGVNPADHPPRGDEQGGLLLNEPAAAVGYTLFTPVDDGNQKVYLIDPLGRLAHKWRLDETLSGRGILHAKLLDNGNLLIILLRTAGEILEIDPRGNIVWQYNLLDVHHDFLKMPNGNVLLIAQAIKTREQAIAAGANPQFVHETGLHYDYIVEVRPTDGASGGEIVWQWSPWDHLIQDFDPTKPNYGAIADHPELIDLNFLLETISLHRQQAPSNWMHANAIDYNPALDQVMLSLRHYSELWIIDHSATTEEARGHAGGNSGMGGDLLYRWGNPRAYGHGTAADQRLFWQHHTHWIPPGLPGAGNILAFSNGKEFADQVRGYSSVDEITPPVDGYRYRRNEGEAYPPDKPTWTYADADFYAPYRSGAHRLPNGNTLITDSKARTIFQVTPDGKAVWKYIAPPRRHISQSQDDEHPARLAYETPDKPSPVVQSEVYRAYWYPPNYPGLQALDLAPGAYIQGDPALLDWARAALASGDFGQPLARSHYHIYLYNSALIYFKRPCAAQDAQSQFFLHIIPARAHDLPAHRHEHGFDNRDFNFNGADVHVLNDDSCIAIRNLPRYPIDRIRTGQFTSAGQQWRAEIILNE